VPGITFELRDIFYIGGIILSAGYAVWRIEGQAKQNKALIDRLAEKHSIFLDNIKSDYNRELEILKERLDGKKKELEEVKKDCEKNKQEIWRHISKINLQLKDMLDKQTADSKYVTKEELQLKLDHIDEKLDTILTFFKRGNKNG